MKENRPPRLPFYCLRWFCKAKYHKDIEGDLLELYQYRLKNGGRSKANWMLFKEVILLFRPGIVKPVGPDRYFFNFDLYKSNLKLAYRHLFKYKSLGLINLFGLIVAFFAVILIMQYLYFEFSYEDFYTNKENIYRVEVNRTQDGVTRSKSATTYTAIGPEAKAGIPAVVDYSRVFQLNDAFFSIENSEQQTKSIRMPKVTLVDEMFLSVFDIKNVHPHALDKPNSIILTSSIAEKLFGNENPLGKTIVQNRGQRDTNILTVTGVTANVPENTHLKYDVLISYSTVFAERSFTKYSWDWSHVHTYLQLRPATDPRQVESQLLGILTSHKEDDIRSGNVLFHLNLRSIKAIHLYSNLQHEITNNGSIKAVYFLILAASIILLISWLNAVNLTYVRHTMRLKEMGVRKAFGARKQQLFSQLIFESFFNNLLAMGMAMLLTFIFRTEIESFLAISLAGNVLLNPVILCAIFAIVIISAFISSVTPSQLKTVFGGAKSVVRTNVKKQAILRRSAIVIQFTVSFVLVIVTVIVHSQLKYISNFDLGLEKEYSIVVRGSGIPGIENAFDSNKRFKNELLERSWMKSVAACNFVPGQELPWQRGIHQKGRDARFGTDVSLLPADSNIVGTLGLHLLAGQDFYAYASDSINPVILNVTATKALGFNSLEEAIGNQIVNKRNDVFDVVGVIDDYHHSSLREKVDPLMIWNIEYAKYYFILNLHEGNLKENLSSIEHMWKEVFPNSPFVFFFLDDYLDQQYKAEQVFGRFFTLLASAGIFIALLGIFSLTSFFVVQRVKEIGIRKVLGASVAQIIWLLSSHLFFLTVVGVAIAIPIANYMTGIWLENFAFRISSQWGWYTVVGLVIILLSTVIVILQTFKTANTNPSISLKNE